MQLSKVTHVTVAGRIVSLTSIVQEIERRAEAHEIGRLQEIRKELKGKKQLPSSIFHPNTIKEKDGYAFHYGGRTELQFNVAFERGGMFRDGVAFSIEKSRDVLEPEKTLLPSVKRFNNFMESNPRQFSDMWMWHWDENGERSTDYRPAPIQADLVRRGMFIFLGRMQPSNAVDYDLILDDFDRLLPLYQFVESMAPAAPNSKADALARAGKLNCRITPGSRAIRRRSANFLIADKPRTTI